MTIRCGVLMDPIDQIAFKKDSTLAMLFECQRRGWDTHYMEPGDLYLASDNESNTARARTRSLEVFDDPGRWFEFTGEDDVALGDLDVILMRKDPPFDMGFVYLTYYLEMAERAGTLIVNKPASLRDCNEKLFATQFPQCTPPLVVTTEAERIRAFHAEHEDIIVKPLDGMGGMGIFRIKPDDPNITMILDTLTDSGRIQIMAQKYLPEIVDGDKRILLVNGEPVPYALARIPLVGETRGNLAAGGRGVGRELTDRDRWICEQVGPTLKAQSLWFVGIDVIGDYLTEINVTCPTCIRELDAAFDLNIAGQLFDVLEGELAARG